MPIIGNNTRTLLQGLSDFWTRFYADTDELDAMYQATEIQLAQTYLDMLSSFLNISINETPLFNTEYFKLVLAREDQVTYKEIVAGGEERYLLDFPDGVVHASVLQNKVVDPTATLEVDAGYELDKDALQFRFAEDPTGRPETVLGTTTVGNLLTYGVGSLTQFYVTVGEPFALAKPGYWLRLENSGSGNNATYRIAQVVDSQTVLLQGTFTLPDANTGSLTGTLLDSEFSPEPGFGHRIVTVGVGGGFDDAIAREATERKSWYSEAPVGLGVRKGDVLRLHRTAGVEDYPIAVVRHDKLYPTLATPFKEVVSSSYSILRESPDADVTGEVVTFSQVGASAAGASGSILVTGFSVPVATFVAADRNRYLTIGNGGSVTWTASLSATGLLTHTAGCSAPAARAFVGDTISVGGTPFTIEEIISSGVVQLEGYTFYAQTGVSCTLVGRTNSGTYKINRVVSATAVELSLPVTYNDLNNGALTWTLHDGYKATLAHQNIKRTTFAMVAEVAGRDAVENEDFVVDYENGVLTQVGRLAGDASWTAGPPANYTWYTVMIAPQDRTFVGDASDTITVSTQQFVFANGDFTSADVGKILRIAGSAAGNNRDYTIDTVLSASTVTTVEAPFVNETGNVLGTGGVYWRGTTDITTTTLRVNEVAFWAPDALVDKYHLYNTYGYLIDRYQVSSESYRQFIRGVFQLYMLGPTLARVESALNVISNFPVIRDEGETFYDYDPDTDEDYDYVLTKRGTETVTYKFPKIVGDSLVRADVRTATVGTPFVAFEALTDVFVASDYVEDPTWWEDIIIPQELMPSETAARRTTEPKLFSNVINASDGPVIGDPGLFIGADDEGNTPPWFPGNPAPALRRKMANVVMDRFLKYHVMYLSFAPKAVPVLPTSFYADLEEIVFAAKPGYRSIFIEQ